MYPWLHKSFNDLIMRYREAKLHHGLLFMGAPDSGKTDLCQDVAKALLCKNTQAQKAPSSTATLGGFFDDEQEQLDMAAASSETLEACGTCKSCLLIDAGSHPDLHLIVTEKSQIGIDAIRQTITKVSQTAQLSGNKVVIIPQIELMSESASNALLKTLEEPTPNTYLLMTTNESQRLLPTVLSRCEKISVPMPSYEQSADWLHEHNIEQPSKAALLAYGSSPIKYRRELEDPDSVGFDDFIKAVQRLKDGTDSANRAALKWQAHAPKVVLWLAQHWIEDYQLKQSDTAFANYQACIEASKRMNHPGLNKSLILTTLFAQFRSANVASFS